MTVTTYNLSDSATLFHGDCRETLAALPDNCIDSFVTDPPYHLTSVVKRFGADDSAPAQFGTDGVFARASRGFMGKQWDGGDIAFQPALWVEVLRVLKPGGHVAAFGASRGYHRMACAIEDAGFEIRDSLMWIYGTGFPKSHDVSKGIDKAAGAERSKIRVDASEVRNPKATGGGRDEMEGATRPWIEEAMQRGFHEKDSDIAATEAAAEWQGWGTALKPAFEPIVLARKPLSEGTVAANVLRWRTGAINVDGMSGCRAITEYVWRRSQRKSCRWCDQSRPLACQCRHGRLRRGDVCVPRWIQQILLFRKSQPRRSRRQQAPDGQAHRSD